MGTRGTSFTSEATVEIAGYEFSDQVIEGNTNTSILGVKTETIVGGLGIGVAGVWTDVAFVKMEFSSLKLGVNYGSIGEFHYGWKYERSPVGTFEGHDTLFQIIQGAHWTDTQQTWHVSAGTNATMTAPAVTFRATQSAAIGCGTSGVLATATELSANFGPTVALKLTAAAASLTHSVAVSVKSGTNALSVSPQQIFMGAPKVTVNGYLVELGQPPVPDPVLVDETFAYMASLFAEAEEEAAVIEAAVEVVEDEPWGIEGFSGS